MKTICAKTRMDTALCDCNPCETTVTTGQDSNNRGHVIRFAWADQDHPRRVEVLFADFIPAHCLVILAGREGAGKSHLAALLLSFITRGELPGDHAGQKQKVLVMGTEDSWHSRWVPRLWATQAVMANVARDPSFVTKDDEGNEVLDLVAISDPDNLRALARSMAAEEITVLYLDHLGTALKAGLNYNSYGDMTEALQRLNVWAVDHRITVIGGWHLSKGGGNVADKVIGSVGLQTSARCVLQVGEDPEEELRVVAVTKCNDLDVGTIKAKSFTITGTTVEINGESFAASIASDLKDHDHPGSGKQYVQRLIDAADFRDRPTDKQGNSLDADAWLVAHFHEHGPKLMRKAVVAWAEVVGYSERTIDRSFVRLGGQSLKVGREAQWELGPPTVDTFATRGSRGLSDVGEGSDP